jgi:hypothetical protein
MLMPTRGIQSWFPMDVMLAGYKEYVPQYDIDAAALEDEMQGTYKIFWVTAASGDKNVVLSCIAAVAVLKKTLAHRNMAVRPSHVHFLEYSPVCNARLMGPGRLGSIEGMPLHYTLEVQRV